MKSLITNKKSVYHIITQMLQNSYSKSKCVLEILNDFLWKTYKAKNNDEYKEIGRKLNKREYDLVCDMLCDIENGYIQDLEDFAEEYVPDFDLSGV